MTILLSWGGLSLSSAGLSLVQALALDSDVVWMVVVWAIEVEKQDTDTRSYMYKWTGVSHCVTGYHRLPNTLLDFKPHIPS